jgi:Fe2+ or Zn2+ uptake regulation protein
VDDAQVEAAIERLRAAGHRVTSPRRAILKAVASGRGRHLTAEEIFGAVQRTQTDVHMATVYRNLDTLAELGLVEHTHLGHGPAVFRMTTDAHDHLVCERCGSVTDVPSKLFRPVRRRMRDDYGFELGSQHFAITGVCAGCA